MSYMSENKEKLSIVKITWEDAVANANWFIQSQVEEWGKLSRCLISEIGYLVLETEEYILLASSIAEETPISEKKLGLVHLIPKKSIITYEKSS